MSESMPGSISDSMETRSEKLLAFHAKQTGGAETKLFQAPGRVNLLGEHTDYSGGFCMPAALNFNTLIAASLRADDVLRLHSMDADYGTAEISLAELRNPGMMPKGDDWTSYCFGVAWSLLDHGVRLQGAELSLTGNVPQGAGLSSSASVEVAMATALLGLAGKTIPGAEIALLCQRAENVYVGAPCGIMDQFISAKGVRDHALAIDTRALTSELAPIPESLRLVVCNSMVKHAVAGANGPYATVRRQVEEAATALGKRNPAIKQLRDATLDDLNAGKADMSDVAFKRARHVITDSQRVLDGVAALKAGDTNRFGQLMIEAHASYRDDFGASCRECDILVELAIALPGCLGSRLTGGGFGGCTVSLVEADHAESFAAALRAGYLDKTGVHADEFICEVADGAGPVGS